MIFCMLILILISRKKQIEEAHVFSENHKQKTLTASAVCSVPGLLTYANC